MKSTRRGFLALLGIGAAALPGGAWPNRPRGCCCPVETCRAEDMIDATESVIVHLSRRCAVHGSMAQGEAGCGVYACDFKECHNPRTRGLGPQSNRFEVLHRFEVLPKDG